MRMIRRLTALTLLGLAVTAARAGVLPEDRADALYHYYDGGGVEVDGPSVLVRKQVLEDWSVYGNLYLDSVSSASIDVLATASPYSEDRTEVSIGGDYLRGDTLMSLSYTNSDEDDYTASTINFGIAQEVFGGMTTVTLGYGRGSDEVRRNDPLGGLDDAFGERDLDRRNYRLGVSQVLTRRLLVSMNYEAITDEGYLNNPYRSVRFLHAGSATGFSYEAEVYPNTRSSNAISVRSRYYLEPRAAVHGGYRFFTDDWGIDAHNIDIGYTRPFAGGWLVDAGYRYYTQEAADFYSDLFPFEQSQNFLARDKELSSFASHTLRIGISYDVLQDGWRFVERGTVNLHYDHIIFDYDNFRDVTAGGAPGEEPLYDFSADVIQLFFSVWF